MYLPELSAGQGSALSGIFTALGAVVGIVIASKFFSGKVKTLSEALDRSKELLENHAGSVSMTLTAITDEVNVLKTSISSLAEQSGRIESNTIENSELQEVDQLPEAQAISWAELKNFWFEIRDDLERHANSENIDGRRRAAYGRIDRRRYDDLITRMQNDGELSIATGATYRRALALWLSYRNGRRAVTPADYEEMKSMLESLQAT
jgi:hypothetical protein